MRHRRLLLEVESPAQGFAVSFGDFSFLLLAFFLVAGSWTALGGHLHAALPKDMTRC